jgi:uncharacterized protein YbjT (DUF2867 family)
MTHRRTFVGGALALGAIVAALGAALAAIGTARAQAAPGDLVAVVGATGRSGRLVVEQLVAAGRPVRAVVRDVDKAKASLPAGVPVVAGDVRDAAALAAALRGAKYVISAIGAGGGPNPKPGNGPRDVDEAGTANIAKAAKESGVAQLVVISSMGVSKPDANPMAFMRPILAAKAAGEAAVRASGVPYTIVRPGGLADEPGGKLKVQFRQGDTGTGRIPRADVATVAIQALGRTSAYGRTFEIVSGTEPAPNDWVADFAALRPDPSPPTSLSVTGVPAAPQLAAKR